MPGFISPGVYWKEIDDTGYIPALTGVTLTALVGAASKGPINERTFVSSLPNLYAIFDILG